MKKPFIFARLLHYSLQYFAIADFIFFV